MTKKEKDALRSNLNRFAESLDNQWRYYTSETGDKAKPIGAAYRVMIRTFETLGGDWTRDENGHHRIFLFGIRGEAEE